MKNRRFELICAVIKITIDSVNEFAVCITIIITERDFRSDYFFCMCSVATKLVTSQEFNPIRCATTLCHFSWTWNGNVATHFILLSSTAESSATSSYVVIPERFSQNEKPAGTIEERTRKSLVLFPAVDLTEAICKHM